MTVQTTKPTGTPTSLRPRLVLGGMALAAFLSVLNGTTVTASLEPLRLALGGSVAAIVWITTVYLIAAAVSLPLVGWLTDRFGARTVMLLAVGGFTAGSLLCSLAWDISSLTAFRVVQGLAGGMLEPVAMSIAALSTPAERMGRVMGFISMVINLGPVVGPILGSGVIAAGGWQWIFLLNLPLGALVAWVAWRHLPRGSGAREGARVDGIGLALLPLGFVMVLLGINRWGAQAHWMLTWPLVLTGGVLAALYVRHALRSAVPPLLDIRLLGIRPFAAGIGVMSTVGLTMYMQLTMLPLFGARELAGGVLGSDLGRAVPVSVLGVGMLVSMLWAARASDRLGTRPIVRAGAAGTLTMGVMIAGAHTWLPGDLMPWLIVLGVLLIGLTFGMIAAPTFAGLYRVLPAESVAQGNTSMFVVVQLFASAGVTVIGVLTGLGEAALPATYLVIATLAGITLLLSAALPGRMTA